MKRFDLVVPKKYTKDGEEKTAWKQVGSMVRFDATTDKPESYIVELNMFPNLEVKAFEVKPKTDGVATKEEVPF